MTTPLLHTVREGAKSLRISERMFRRLMAAGEIESLQIGRARRVPAAALTAYVERLRTPQDAGVTANEHDAALERWLEQTIADAPPLTAEQADLVAAIFGPAARRPAEPPAA